jgi:transcriptional regulator with XRE-family HTH domain
MINLPRLHVWPDFWNSAETLVDGAQRFIDGSFHGSLSEIEHGKREVGLLTLQTIAAGLDVSMSVLLKGL